MQTLLFFATRLGWVGLDLLWWIWADRAVRPLRRRRVWRAVVAAFAMAQLAYMAYTLVEPFYPLRDPFPLPWRTAAYVWHLGVVLSTVIAVASFRGVSLLTNAGRRRPAVVDGADASSQPSGGEKHSPTRRRVLAGALVGAPTLATASIGAVSLVQLGHFRVSHRRLAVPGLPKDLDGVTIAHVSDLHIGRFLPAGMMSRVAEATNALKADAVAFTGDLIDMLVDDAPAGIEFIRHLDPRGGLVMIEGNHDLFDQPERFEDELKRAGLPLLLDESMTIRLPGRATPLQFLGITWGEWRFGWEIGRTLRRERNRKYRVRHEETTAASVRGVAALREPGAFPILLAHHPHAFDEAARLGLPLTLAGHTHGGQLMLNERLGVGPLRFRYWTGSYRRGTAGLFVNNGVGNWFPLRVNAPAEIVHLTLCRQG